MADDLTLTVGGAALAGWTEVRVTRRLEGCPNDFEIALTERFPGEPMDFLLQAGQACTVQLGGDLVITGYLDKYRRSYDAKSHTIRISGRGKTQDLVDASAEWPGGQITGNNVQEVAEKLGAPYGVEAKCIGDPGKAIPQLNLTYGETAFDIIERICRYAGLLAYEDVDGNLILASGQDIPAASGFVEGVNVQAATVTTSMNERFSEVDAFLVSMDTLSDLGNAGNLAGRAFDPNVPRNRKKFVVAEAAAGAQDVAKIRATWEVARRFGRSFVVELTCDSWRDSGGTLWTPNTVAPVELPGLKLPKASMMIGQVTFRRGPGTGTTADLTLMQPAAFLPEPIVLQPVPVDLAPAPPSPGP